MNGRIQYTFVKIRPGKHEIQFELFRNNLSTRSNTYNFEVLDEISDKSKTKSEIALNLEINLVDEKESICDVVKTKDLITINLCLEHDTIRTVFGHKTSSEIDELKAKIIKPIALFALFMDNQYDEIENAEEKNHIILSFVKTTLATKE